MSGSGAAHNSYLFGGQSGNPIGSSDAGNLYVQSNFSKVKNVGRMVLRTNVATQLPDIPAAWVVIYNGEGNGNVWVGGYGSDAPRVGVGIPIPEGQSHSFPCNNLNQYSLIPETDGSPVYISCGGSGRDVDLVPGDPAPLDLTPPTVSSVFPPSSPAAATNTLIFVTMSEAILPSSVTTNTVTISPAVPFTPSVDSSNPRIINLTHVTNLAFSTVYTVTLNGITDLSGNVLATPFSYSFTSSSAPPPPDTTPPTIVSMNPPNGAAVNASVTPSVTFNEAMKLSSISPSNIGVTLWINGQEIAGGTYSLSADLKTVFLNNITLQPSNIYNLVVAANATGPADLAGNIYKGANTTSQFSTTSASPSSTIYNVTGDSYKTLFAGSTHEVKETVSNSYSSLYGYAPTKYVFTMQKQGSPPGNITFSITHKTSSSTASLSRTIATLSASSIGPTDTIVTVPDSSNTKQLGSNDQICVTYNSGDSSNNILVKVSSYDAIDGSDSYMSTTDANNNNVDFRTADLAMKVDGF